MHSRRALLDSAASVGIKHHQNEGKQTHTFLRALWIIKLLAHILEIHPNFSASLQLLWPRWSTKENKEGVNLSCFDFTCPVRFNLSVPLEFGWCLSFLFIRIFVIFTLPIASLLSWLCPLESICPSVCFNYSLHHSDWLVFNIYLQSFYNEQFRSFVRLLRYLSVSTSSSSVST